MELGLTAFGLPRAAVEAQLDVGVRQESSVRNRVDEQSGVAGSEPA